MDEILNKENNFSFNINQLSVDIGALFLRLNKRT